MSNSQPILVTGAAGFIGAYVCRALAARGDLVVGVDNFNAYYSIQLKQDRVAALCPEVLIERIDIADKNAFDAIIAKHQPRAIIHLAAQAGVRHSLIAPYDYLHSNLQAFLNVLEACRQQKIPQLVFASSSSVYGANAVTPFAENQRADQPLSLYAASKAANELMAHSYAHLYGFACTGLRFFTVYGPWGRPDMAPILFSRAILQDQPIQVFNRGQMRRDFTYIDDIVDGVIAALDRPAIAEVGHAPFKVYNLGNNFPVELAHFIATLEKAAGKSVEKIYQPMQPGDMLETCANIDAAVSALGFSPRTKIEQGLPQLMAWAKLYFAGDIQP